MKEIKDIAITFFYFAMAISIVVFTVNYAFIDWDGLSDGIGETIEGMEDILSCHIEYCGFVYDGICVENDNVFDFLKNMTCDYRYYTGPDPTIEISVPDNYWEEYLDSLPKYINYTVCPKCPECNSWGGIYWYNSSFVPKTNIWKAQDTMWT